MQKKALLYYAPPGWKAEGMLAVIDVALNVTELRNGSVSCIDAFRPQLWPFVRELHRFLTVLNANASHGSGIGYFSYT
jgi:hypothetical protein